MKSYNSPSSLRTSYILISTPSILKTFYIFRYTRIFLSRELDFNSVKDVILRILPEDLLKLNHQVILRTITVSIHNGTAYWDLLFECPEDYDFIHLPTIIDNVSNLEDSFDCYNSHFPVSNADGSTILHKITFKVK